MTLHGVKKLPNEVAAEMIAKDEKEKEKDAKANDTTYHVSVSDTLRDS